MSRDIISKDQDIRANLDVSGDVNVGGIISSGSLARDRKDSVETVATSDVTLSGEQTINGVLTSNSRVAPVNQTDPAENGIYVTAAGAWTRSSDMDEDTEVTNGLNFLVSGAASTKVEFRYVLTTADPITIGVTGLVFAEHQPGILDVKGDLTPQLGGTFDTNGEQVRWSKGADVASAATLPLISDGNNFDVTGTDAILEFASLAVGTVILLHFDDVLTLTHDAADLILPAELNIVTQAGDEGIFHEYAAGDYRLISWLRADGTPLVGGASGTSPLDDKRTTPVSTVPRDTNYFEQIFGLPKQINSLAFIDTATGLQTLAMPLINPPVDFFGTGLEVTSDNQIIVWNDDGAGIVEFATIDPATGQYTQLSTSVVPGTLHDSSGGMMTFHPDGTLYAAALSFDLSAEHLVTLDHLTGVYTDIAATSIDISTGGDDSMRAMAIKRDPADPQAFCLVRGTGSAPNGQGHLYGLNLVTGEKTQIGDTGFNRPSQLFFDAAGVLYSIMRNRSTNDLELVTINLSTGVASSVGRTFYEDQFPGASNFAMPGGAMRPLSTAASEFSPGQHNSLALAHEYGVVNAYKVTQHPNPPAFIDGQMLNFITTIANNAACTLDYNEKGPDAFVKRDGTALSTGDILANVPYQVQRDEANTRWKLLNPGS